MATRTVSLLLSLVIGVNFLASCTLVEDVKGEGAKLSSSGQSEEDVWRHADVTTHSAEDAELLLRRGISSASEGQYDEAAADFDAAIAISPDDLRAYLYRGVVSGIRGGYEKAAADHRMTLRVELLSPEDAAIEHEQWRSSITMWAIYLRSGDYDKAIKDYDTFTSISPEEADAYMWRGCAYYLKGEVDRAVADYDKALALSPDNALALYKRGLAHARLGNSSQADRDFARAMAIGFDEAAGESGGARTTVVRAVHGTCTEHGAGHLPLQPRPRTPQPGRLRQRRRRHRQGARAYRPAAHSPVHRRNAQSLLPERHSLLRHRLIRPSSLTLRQSH